MSHRSLSPLPAVLLAFFPESAMAAFFWCQVRHGDSALPGAAGHPAPLLGFFLASELGGRETKCVKDPAGGRVTEEKIKFFFPAWSRVLSAEPGLLLGEEEIFGSFVNNHLVSILPAELGSSGRDRGHQGLGTIFRGELEALTERNSDAHL